MIYLHQFRPIFGVPNLSPFCMKVETWLRITGLEYRSVYEDDPRKGPLGKLPSIVDGNVTVPDSTLILDHLEQAYEVCLDDHLTDEELAISHAFQRMLEEHLYWACVYNRWVDSNWPEVKQAAFGNLPPVVRDIVPAIVRRKLTADLKAQGLGLHEQETIYEFACRDIQAVAVYLAEKPYFMGDQPSTIDAILFAFLSGIIKTDLPSPMRDFCCEYDNLMSYHQRLGKQYFPDYY